MGEAKRRRKLDPSYGKSPGRWKAGKKLRPDYGSMLAKTGADKITVFSEGNETIAMYYPTLGFAEFHTVIGSHMATIQIPCEKREVPKIAERLEGGFFAELSPNRAKAFTVPNGTERVIPLEVLNLDEFMRFVYRGSF